MYNQLIQFKEKLINIFITRLKIPPQPFTELMEYHISSGKLTRASITLFIISKYKSVTEEDLVISYLNEMLQTSFLILDDVIDEGELRRGKKCWHLIRKQAVSDAYFLLGCIGKMINLINPKLFDVYKNTLIRTSLGETQDTLVGNEFLQMYNFYNYDLICTNKNACYTFYFPITLGICTIKKTMPPQIFDFCVKLGKLHQMQDDNLDFNNSGEKSCLDVQQKKVTWFMCKHLERFPDDLYLNSEELQSKLIKYKEDFEKEERELLISIKEFELGEFNFIKEMLVIMLDKRRK